MTDLQIALLTKGHPFEREPFFQLFDGLAGVEWTHVEQPAAQCLFDPDNAAMFDAFVLYDMPGIRFHADRAPDFQEPPARFVEHFDALVDRGFGFVFLHHAIAGWPAFSRYAEVIGGRFSYLPGTFAGKPVQDSGYRHGVTHDVRKLADHPVTEGVPESFSMTDELYLFEVLEANVTPLLASNHTFVDREFFSAAKVVRDQEMFSNEGWSHDPGSPLVGWAREIGRSRLVYLQGGDDPVAYANVHYQRLLANAIRWVSERGI
ncbi:MAG: ThuA domain-containing protein [Pseudomonadota bacterium]